MANKIDSHINNFAGIDTRTNQMYQNPKSARDGQNFYFRSDGNANDFDVLAKRRGAQHKSYDDYSCEIGKVEYKYKDINTGESKTQILGVARDGKLRKRYKHRLKIARSGGAAAYYSFFYNPTASNWKMEFFNSSYASLGSTTCTTSTDLATLVTNLTALAITGLTFSVEDADGTAVVSSTLLAYLLDVVYRAEIIDSDSTYNDVYSWSVVETPNSTNVIFEYVANGAWLTNRKFEGISFVNLNNSVYITDGGFPIKYDGYTAYRAGLPRVMMSDPPSVTGAISYDHFDLSGNSFASSAIAGSLGSGVYLYLVQYGYVDPNGVEILSKQLDGYYMDVTATAAQSINMTIAGIKNTSDFPVYGCKVNGALDLNSGAKTITVDTGHNVKAGMLLRIPVSNSNIGLPGMSYMMCMVNSVTATTITLDTIPSNNLDSYWGSTTVIDNQYLNAGYAPSFYEGKITNVVGSGASTYRPVMPFGAFMRVSRSAVGGSTVKHLYDVDLPYDGLTTIYNDGLADSNLGVEFDFTEGEDLPRACRYLSKWQDQLIQAGRPYDAENLKDTLYPSNYSGASFVNGWGFDINSENVFGTYTEVHLCDFQSIYWSDPLNPEGFPQSGLFEESFDTKFNDEISGMAENKDAFYVFKDRSMGFLTGSLGEGNISKEILEVDYGCCAHDTIQEVQGALVWLDANYGFCTVISGRMPKIIGFPVQDKVKKNIFLSRLSKLRFKGAKSANHRIDDIYICYVPAGYNDVDNTTSVPYPQTDSLAFVFDYSETVKGTTRNCWYIWKDLNMAGGIFSLDDELWFCSWVSTFKTMWKFKKTGSIYDFSDHTSAISFIYKTAWQNYNLYSIDKKWIQVAINSILKGFTLLVSQYYNYLDTKVGEVSKTFTSTSTASAKTVIQFNNIKAQAMSVGLENNTIYEDVVINGFDIQFSPDFDPNEVKT